MSSSDRYSSLGVSARKEDISDALSTLKPSSSKYAGAFCQPVNNPFSSLISSSEKDDILYLSHADGVGTKGSLAYLYWRETGDLEVFRNLVQDAMMMNTEDLLCVGVHNAFAFSSTIARNKHRIPGEVLTALIKGQEEKIEWLRDMGVEAWQMGGETADLGDIVQTLSVDMTASTFIKENDFIHASDIKPGLVIVGLASYGQTSYEEKYNSGIGSNGLTLARHLLLNGKYREKYPETFDQQIKELAYQGEGKVEDSLVGIDLNLGQALLSPTRTYLPVMKKIFSENIKVWGLIHNTGGGLGKSGKFGNNIHYIKDKLFDLPPLFEILSANLSDEEFLTSFNAGQRMEIYLDESQVESVLNICQSFNLSAQVIGRTEHSETGNRVTVNFREKTLELK